MAHSYVPTINKQFIGHYIYKTIYRNFVDAPHKECTTKWEHFIGDHVARTLWGGSGHATRGRLVLIRTTGDGPLHTRTKLLCHGLSHKTIECSSLQAIDSGIRRPWPPANDIALFAGVGWTHVKVLNRQLQMECGTFFIRVIMRLIRK